MWKLFAAGIVLAIAVSIANFALHLLNQPSDASVAGGYVILLALVSAAAGLLMRRRN